MNSSDFSLRVFLMILVVLVLSLVLPSSLVTAAEPATITSDGPSTAASGNTVTVSINLTNAGTAEENYIADVSMPTGWSVQSQSDDSGEWNSGDKSWLWQNVDSSESVTPSISLAVPDDESSGSYTIETAAKTSEGTVATTSHSLTIDNPNDGDDGSSDDGSSDDESEDDGQVDNGGEEATDTDGSEATEEAEADSTDNPEEVSIEAAVEQVEKTDPDSETELSIEEANGDLEETTVTTDQTGAVQKITFSDDSASGTVVIREYNEAPEEVSTQVAESIEQDIENSEPTADGVESSTSDSSTNSGQSTEENINVVSMAEISPSSESAANSEATITLNVDGDRLTDPSNAYITHETSDGWEQLETTIESQSNGEITLTASTESFSLFAVVEPTEVQQGETSSNDDDPSSTNDIFSLSTIIGVVFISILSVIVLWIKY